MLQGEGWQAATVKHVGDEFAKGLLVVARDAHETGKNGEQELKISAASVGAKGETETTRLACSGITGA